jgi:hypothetical protein
LKRIIAVAALTVVVGLGSIGTAFPQRALPEDNLGYPVLVTIGNGQASGFYARDTKSVFFVTAKHVLFDPGKKWGLRAPTATLLSYGASLKEAGRNLLTLDLAKLSDQGNVKADPSEDVAIVKIATQPANPPSPTTPAEPTAPLPPASLVFASPIEGVTINERTNSGPVIVDVSKAVKTFDHVLIGNDVLLSGYPVSLALVANPKIDFSRLLLRVVAGEDVPEHSIILDCPSYEGDSGAPIIEVDTISAFEKSFSVIGVMNSFVPSVDVLKSQHFGYSNTTVENSGYSIITPMDYVLELMK